MIARALLSCLICTCGAVCAVAIVQALYGDKLSSDRRHAVVAPVAALALAGFVLGWRGANQMQIMTVALLGVALAGSWYADARLKRVPDIFTLLPLGIIAIAMVFRVFPLIDALSGFMMLVFFSAGVLMSKGRGMSWGDAKVATLGATIVGFPLSLLVMGVAGLSATVVSVIKNRGTEPIAFAPYISGFVLLDIVLTVHA